MSAPAFFIGGFAHGDTTLRTEPHLRIAKTAGPWYGESGICERMPVNETIYRRVPLTHDINCRRFAYLATNGQNYPAETSIVKHATEDLAEVEALHKLLEEAFRALDRARFVMVPENFNSIMSRMHRVIYDRERKVREMERAGL